MFNIASEWKLIINESRANEKAFIPAIEPKINFTSSIIGIFVTSPSSPNSWYLAGELLQIYPIGFGNSGSAQGDYLKIVLNRYQVYRFNKFSSESTYSISFLPKFYLKRIDLKVWEYMSEEQINLENLQASINATRQKLVSETASIKSLIKKLHQY